MLRIFRRKKIKEEIEIAEEREPCFEIDFYVNKKFSIDETPLLLDYYYRGDHQDYETILIALQTKYAKTYATISDCLDSLIEQHFSIAQLEDTIETHVRSSGIKGTQHIQKLVQGCFDAYSQNRDDAVAIFKHIYVAKKADNSNDLIEKYKKQLEDLVADNDKIIESLKGFLTAFGKYLSNGDERFTPEHFMDMGAIRRLEQFSKLLEGISEANEATMQELIARLAKTPANDNNWQERLENVPKIVLDPEVSTAPTADGF